MQQPSMMDPYHGISCETLEEMCAARQRPLVARGMDRQTARVLAVYELYNRIELAKTVGPDAALLANSVWEDLGSCGFTLSLAPDGTPNSLEDEFFVEADLYPKNDDQDDLTD